MNEQIEVKFLDGCFQIFFNGMEVGWVTIDQWVGRKSVTYDVGIGERGRRLIYAIADYLT